MSPNKKVSPWLIAICVFYGLAFFYLLAQNFVFSESFELLGYREIDDVAFQSYIRGRQENFRFLKLNAFAYGWIFWYPILILTYPFYYLSTHFSIDMPLIVIPRQLSLFFSFATAILLYKITSIYTKNNFLKFLALGLFLSYPTFGFFSMRFGTVTQTMFFSCLTFYLAARRPRLNRKDFLLIGLAMAAAVGTKLSALLVAPAVAMVMVDRTAKNFNKKVFINYLYCLLVFFMGFLALGQINLPGVLSQMKKTQTSYGGESLDFLGLVSSAIGGFTVYGPILYLTCAGLIISFLMHLKKESFYKRDFLYLFLTLVLAISYLVVRIKMGTAYIAVYFTVISYFLPLGLLCLAMFNRSFQYILGFCILTANLYFNWNQIAADSYISSFGIKWNSYFVRAQQQEVTSSIAFQESLRRSIVKPKEFPSKLHFLRAYQVPTFYSSFNKNVSEVIFFDNIEEVLGSYSASVGAFDFVGLNKRGHGYMTDEAFAKATENASPEIQKKYRANREFIQNFVKKREMSGAEFDLFKENSSFVYFIKKDLLEKIGK